MTFTSHPGLHDHVPRSRRSGSLLRPFPRTHARIIAAACACLALVAARPAHALDPITDIVFVQGSNSSVQPPAGYERIDPNLNKGSGSSTYIYCCIKRGGPGAPITDAYVQQSGSVYYGDPPQAPTQAFVSWPWYQRIAFDLNRGAGGAYIYLWVSRDPSCRCIRDIVVREGQNTPVPAGYWSGGVNLNAGAGGAYLDFCFLTQ